MAVHSPAVSLSKVRTNTFHANVQPHSWRVKSTIIFIFYLNTATGGVADTEFLLEDPYVPSYPFFYIIDPGATICFM